MSEYREWLVLAAWVVSGFVSYGIVLGTFTHRYPYVYHFGAAVLVSLFGPVGLAVFSILNGPIHWRLKPLNSEQRWLAYHEELPRSPRKNFERDYN